MEENFPRTKKIGDAVEAAGEIPDDALKIDIDGKVYLLHHSHTPIEVGEKILPSGTVGLTQSTAGDTFKGYSYGWDARDPDAVSAALSGGNAYSAGDASAVPPHVMITAADEAQVHPDLNVPGTLSRAIKGEQTVLARVSRLPDESVEDFSTRIRDQLGILGKDLGVDLSPRTVEEASLINYGLSISDRAQNALSDAPVAIRNQRVMDLIHLAGDPVTQSRVINKTGVFSPDYTGQAKNAPANRAIKLIVEEITSGQKSVEAIGERIRAEIGTAFDEFAMQDFGGVSLPKFEGVRRAISAAGELGGKRVGVMSKRTLGGILDSLRQAMKVTG